jgi:hypothetical protein
MGVKLIIKKINRIEVETIRLGMSIGCLVLALALPSRAAPLTAGEPIPLLGTHDGFDFIRPAHVSGATANQSPVIVLVRQFTHRSCRNKETARGHAMLAVPWQDCPLDEKNTAS